MSYTPPPSLEAIIIGTGIIVILAATPFIAIAALVVALVR
jgi:hypothetical protein